MSAIRFTAEAVEALPITGKDSLYFDSLVTGFGIRVTKAGKKIFIIQRRVNGKTMRITLGYHPEMTVAAARDAARKKLVAMSAGVDPRARPAEIESVPEASFTEAVDKWLREHVRLKLKPLTVRDYEIIAQHLKDRFEGRALASIVKDDARQLHADKASTPRRANYYLSILGTILTYNDHPNLTSGIKRYREGGKERILSTDEIGLVFDAITALEAEKRLSVHACAALRFAILTGSRPKEIQSIEWKYLDHERKRVVLPDSKANRQRIIYCNAAAWAVLTSTPQFGMFVFAGQEKDTAMLGSAMLG